MNDRVVGKRVRRKRAWYVRRQRAQRTLLAVAMMAVIAAACWKNAARYTSLPTIHASQVMPASFWVRGNVHDALARAAAQSLRPSKSVLRIPNVYPYSIVPGGLKDASDLRYAALRDYVIRRHYARFNFEQARLLRAAEAREVYLSYRIRDSVYWTRKKVRLHPGELLLTDGKITARARCGNQISDTAKPDVSDEEPDEDVLDQPVAGIAPGKFPALPMLRMADLPPFDPADPKLFASSFIFPYQPINAPLPGGRCPAGEVAIDGHCRKKPGHKPVIPEPSTMILAMTGLSLLAWRSRKLLRPAACKSF